MTRVETVANVARMGKVGKLNRAAAFASVRRMFEADGYDVTETHLEPVGRSFTRARLEFEAAEVGADVLHVLYSTKYVDVRIRPRSARRVRVVVEGLTES